MPRRTIDTIIDIMEKCKSAGYEFRIPAKELLKIISFEAGSDQPTRDKYINLMQEWGFIVQIDVEEGRFFDLNYNAVFKYQ